MQHNIVKKMLMVMALSTSMAFGSSTPQSESNAFNVLGNDSSTKVKSSKKTRKHNKHSNVQSLASQFESGAVNNASNSLIKDPIVSASTPVADTVSQLNSSNTIKGPTANISDLVPINAQDSSVFSAAPAPTPSTSELVGLSGGPAANQDSSVVVPAQSPLPLDTSLTVPASNNLMPSDQNAMPALDLNSDPQELVKPLVSAGDLSAPLSNDSFGQGSGVFSSNDSLASTVVAPQSKEPVSAQSPLPLDTPLTVPASNNLIPSDQNVMPALDFNNDTTPATPFPSPVLSGIDPVADQLVQHQEAVAANTAAQLEQHQEAVAVNTAAQLDQHQEAVAVNTAAQLDQHQEAVAANTAAQLDQHQEAVAANTAAQLEQHQGVVATQLAQHQETLLSAIKDSANSAPVSEVPVVSAPVSEVPVLSAPVSEDAQPIVPVSEVPVLPAPVAEVDQPVVPVSEVPVVSAPVAEVDQPVVPVSEVTVVSAPVAEVDQPVVPVSEVPVVELPKLPAEIMERIENAAKKSIELKGIVGGKADKDMLQAELATVKAANDLQIAKAGKNVANTIDNISKRLTELLRLPEAECVKELEAIVAELKAIESEIYPDNHSQIADSMHHNSIEADSHIGAENLPFADGDYQSEYNN